jgi:hypothetical protein
MKNLMLIAIVIASTGVATTNEAGACKSRFPTFELMGFPISSHQVAVLGSAHVEESLATPELMLAGMPASPHQIAVLTRRLKTMKIVEASAGIIPELTTVGLTPTRLPIRATDAAVLCASD